MYSLRTCKEMRDDMGEVGRLALAVLTADGILCAEDASVVGLGVLSLSDAAFEALPCMAMLLLKGRVVARNLLARRLTGFAGGEDEPAALNEVLIDFWPGLGERAEQERVRFDCSVYRRHGPALRVSAAAERMEIAGVECTLLLMMEHARRVPALGEMDGSFLEDLLDASPGATVVTHDGRVLYVNAEFTRMFDYVQAETVGRDLDELVIPDGRLHEAEMIEHQLASAGRAFLETQRRTRTGRQLEVSLTVSRLRLGAAARGQLITYQDIHEKKQEEARLRHTALHDGLTGLANRTLFLNRAELMMARLRRRPNRGFAIVFVDLDGFKEVNDRLGHAAGDTVLLVVANRLAHCVRPQDTVARMGGDEFALLIDEVGSDAGSDGAQEGGEQEMALVAERLQVEIGKAIVVGSGEATVSASIGVALASVAYAGTDADAMLRDADGAMYEAKKAGKAGYRICVRQEG